MDADALQRWLDETPFHGQLGTLTISPTDDGVEIRADLAPTGANDATSGVAHGGVAATLLDSALTFALIAATGGDWTTVDLRIDYLRPVPIGAVVVAGRVVKAGRRVGRAEGSLLDGRGDVCARAIGTFVPVD
jgi:uncharacterized protein (TIGR00369 family)